MVKEQNVQARFDLESNYRNYLTKKGNMSVDKFETCLAILDYISTFNMLPEYKDMKKINIRHEYNNADFRSVVSYLVSESPILLERVNIITNTVDYIPRSLVQLCSRFNEYQYFSNEFNYKGKIGMNLRTSFENYISSVSSNGWTSYWARIDSEFEVDTIDFYNELLIEVKYSDKYRADWLKNLRKVSNYLPRFGGFSRVVVYLGETFVTDDGIEIINIYDFMKKYHNPVTIIPNPLYKGDICNGEI